MRLPCKCWGHRDPFGLEISLRFSCFDERAEPAGRGWEPANNLLEELDRRALSPLPGDVRVQSGQQEAYAN